MTLVMTPSVRQRENPPTKQKNIDSENSDTDDDGQSGYWLRLPTVMAETSTD